MMFGFRRIEDLEVRVTWLEKNKDDLWDRLTALERYLKVEYDRRGSFKEKKK